MNSTKPNQSRCIRLAGQALANAYAALFSHMAGPWGHDPVADGCQAIGSIHGRYEGGGWIVVSGSGLKPHPDMVAQYPKGWSMLHRVRSSRARKEIAAVCV